MKKIGYLGPKGTFTELALETYIKTNKLTQIERVAGNSIFGLFRLIESKTCDEVVIPIENSVEGFVSSTMDLLVNTRDLFIKEEIIIPIKHSLLAKEAAELDQITHVMSHPQALAQCRTFINTYLPHAKIAPTESTALAAELVEISPNVSPQFKKIRACIGSKQLAAIYNLKILKENINDFNNNQTRFIVLSNKQSEKSENSKTSIVFSTKEDSPGSLNAILTIFSEKGLNLTHISSRPSKMHLGDYVFFIDVVGHQEETTVKEALNQVKNQTDFFKVLGSYKKGSAYA